MTDMGSNVYGMKRLIKNVNKTRKTNVNVVISDLNIVVKDSENILNKWFS